MDFKNKTLADKEREDFIKACKKDLFELDFVKSYQEYLKLSARDKTTLLLVVASENANLSVNTENSEVKRNEFFRPDKKNYFGRLNHNSLMIVCAEIMGNKWVDERNNLQKKELVESITKIFEGKDNTVDKKTMASINKWMPKELR